MSITLKNKNLEAARIAVELEVVLPAVNGWRTYPDDIDPVDYQGLVDERDEFLDLLVAVGRLGDPRTSVTLNADCARLLRIAANGVQEDLLRRAQAGDGCAEDDWRALHKLTKRLK